MSSETSSLDQPLSILKGVGPARVRAFDRLGIETLGDLLHHAPRRVESSGMPCTLGEALDSEASGVFVFHGTVTKKRFHRFGRRNTLRLSVAEGERELEVVYFNQPWQRDRFEKGETYTFAGRIQRSGKGPVLVAPKSAPGAGAIEGGRSIPIYGLPKGVGPELMRSLLRRTLDSLEDLPRECLTSEELAGLDLPELPEALESLHFPGSAEEFQRARRRVMLQELLQMQMRVQGAPRSEATSSALPVPVPPEGTAPSELALPFELTGGQRDVLGQVERDLARKEPMRRLLQGDVGAGKTVVALIAAARVARAGGQCAFMAPTELLAEQHHAGALPLLEAAGLRCALLTGSQPTRQRKATARALECGEIDIVFGTHALFSRSLIYRQLAFCVIDEQQRFGVAQRARLLEKGGAAHLLLMTATPIPRTLALTVYGNLEVSVLREKPAGRGPIKTRWLRPKDGERVPRFLEERIAAGEQVYWVCPRIGSEEEGGAELAFERLSTSSLAPNGVSLVHGQLDPEVRAARLDAFRRGETKLLVATTVIEVGVDVPAATVMVIEEAERLGLAQLHQLRGRVGRGGRASWCLLYGKPVAKERFELLESCDDGFEIAEEDLRRRGMGELAGLRQSGEVGGLFTDLEDDLDLLLAARELLSNRPELRDSLRDSGPG